MQTVYFDRECRHIEDDQFDSFRSDYTEIPAGGGLVSNKNGEYLLIYRHKLWDLPKGKQEPGESISECALREVQEETGLQDLELGELICVTHHTYRAFGLNILKHTTWYRMTDNREEPLLPQLEEDITGAQWVRKECLPEYLEGTYPSIREVFTAAGLL